MARITVEDCLEQVGDDNRFALVHLAVERIRQHRDGEPFLEKGKNITARSGAMTKLSCRQRPKKRRKQKASRKRNNCQSLPDKTGK